MIFDFYHLPEPDEVNHINYMGLQGGFQVCFDLYEGDDLPELVDCGAYAFYAINRRMETDEDFGGLKRSPLRGADSFSPYTEGGLSDTFIVYPLEMLDDPVATGITDVCVTVEPAINCWYTIDGRCLGTARPTSPGLYISGGLKVIIR